MKKLLCKIFGHKYRYNFTWMPSKCICARCHKKWHITGNLMDDWVEVDEFNDNYNRSDEELIKVWYKV